MTRIKPGVRLHGLRPELVVAIIIARDLIAGHGVDLVITCGIDGEHMAHSKHYTGSALDIRTRDLSSAGEAASFARELAGALGDDFDVVLEGDHIHIEFDPGRHYGG